MLTNRSPAFDDVATALNDYFEEITVYDLDDKSLPPVLAFRLINDSATDVVVAIGLRAARSSIAMSAVPVVFAQVFNHQDQSLLGDKSRGVAAVAPMESQLAAWKDAEPELESVGLIVGPGHDELLREADLAAERHGVTLTSSIARSDQEALYNFKRMSRNIDGLLLVPDNRILSTRVLTEIFEHAESRGVSVLVPSPGMLSLGASISVSTVASDIAAKIHDVIQTVAKRYPMMAPADILADLIKTTPGEEGKWFATAKELELYDLALELADQSPCDPKTLTRAARDYLDGEPAFALGSAMAAMRWLSEGWGYEVTSIDVVEAYDRAMDAATRLNKVDEVSVQIRLLVEVSDNAGRRNTTRQFVRQALQGRV